MKISLSLTHNCNLRCKYCYAGEKFQKDMDFQTAKKIVDFAYSITPKDEEINFNFFGGEPFLRFEIIKKIISYIESKKTFQKINYNITTNGTILNDEIIDFINKHQIKLCISIDGKKEIHDKNRVDIHGNGTLDLILKNLQKISQQIEYYQVNSVYGEDTIENLPETFDFLVEKGVKNIHFNPNITQKWHKESFETITASYEKIGQKYIELYKNKKEVSLNLIDSKIILFLKGGYEEKDKCHMGEKEFGFAPSGNIYPCERLIGDDTNKEMCMGNIHTGFNPFKRCQIVKGRENLNLEYQNCPVKEYCMNWCGCTNFHLTGYPDKMSAMLCHSERAAISVAKKVFLELKENENYINHLISYAYN